MGSKLDRWPFTRLCRTWAFVSFKTTGTVCKCFKQLINPAWPAEDPEKIIFRSYHANQILFQMDLGDQMAFVACHNVCTYFHPSHSSELIGIWPSGLKDQESYTSNENLLWSENGCVKSIPDSCVDYLDIAIINVSTVTGVDMSEIQSEASTRKKVELKENHYRAYKYIEDNQPVVASAIAKFCKIKETTFRKHWLPELRKSGVSSSPDGYVIEDTDFIF